MLFCSCIISSKCLFLLSFFSQKTKCVIKFVEIKCLINLQFLSEFSKKSASQKKEIHQHPKVCFASFHKKDSVVIAPLLLVCFSKIFLFGKKIPNISGIYSGNRKKKQPSIVSSSSSSCWLYHPTNSEIRRLFLKECWKSSTIN